MGTRDEPPHTRPGRHHPRYYPVNENYDFNLYEHRSLSARDIMIHDFMDYYMRPHLVPSRLGFRTWDFPRDDPSTIFLSARVIDSAAVSERDTGWVFGDRGVADEIAKVEGLVWDDKRTTGILRKVRCYLHDTDPSVRAFFAHLKRFHVSKSGPPVKYGGPSKMGVDHLKSFRGNASTHQRFAVFSGGRALPVDTPGEVQFSIDPCFMSYLFPPRWLSMPLRPEGFVNFVSNYLAGISRAWQDRFELSQCQKRGRSRRSSSLPPPRSWRSSIPDLTSYYTGIAIVYFPNRKISELEKLCRRRSLSRTHIRAMFNGPAKVTLAPRNEIPTAEALRTKHPCENCTARTHTTRECKSPCGHCNNDGHKANRCPVKPSNRCKCLPFPQRHVAADCKVRCSRRCGNPHPPSHNRHLNAMTCSYRCCMCGIRGHSGKECKFKRCRCGGQHLGQDCRWKVECVVQECDRYLCGLHCFECGIRKEKGVAFVGFRCPGCLGNGRPVGAGVRD